MAASLNDWLTENPRAVLRAVEAELCRRSLSEFLRRGWHTLEPSTPLEWNWHLDAIAFHVQAVLEDWMLRQQDPDALQRIQNLLINIPPGTAKSRVISVFTPAWMWTRWPAWKSIFLSANPRVANRDSMYCRDVILSDWYQQTFRPTWRLKHDSNNKTVYHNTEGGFRQALGWFAKITGDRADALMVDDPHDASEVESEVIRLAVLQRWDDAIFNRVNDVRSSVRIGVMQRLHEGDWSGHVLLSKAWEHLCLPQEFEVERACQTVLGWRDPRTEEGELLFPLRFPREFLEQEKHPTRLGSYGYAGQHQQRPAPRAGGMIQRGWLKIVDAAPTGGPIVRYWDKAGTEGGTGARSAGVKMTRGADGKFYVLDVVKGRWSSGGREQAIKQTAELDGRTVHVWVEQEPGSGGKESAENTVRNLAGWIARAESVTGDKVTRAGPLAAQAEADNVRLVRGEWNAEYIDELALFPNGKLKDQVDASSGAFNKLALKGVSSPSVVGGKRASTGFIVR